MDPRPSKETDLTGSLLVAVPTLLDPSFRRSIVFLTRHDPKEGALGIILNRPCGKTLGELADPPEDLRTIPVFEGGPMERHHLLLARILLMENGARMESLDRDESETMPEPAGFRAFSGYAGWTSGQLEAELDEKSWLVMPPTGSLLSAVETPEEGELRWRDIVRKISPLYHLLAEAPDDLSLN